MSTKANLYRNYTSWLLATEPRFRAIRLERAQFRKLVIGLFGTGLFLSLLLWQRMQVVKLGYDVSQLRTTRDELAYTQARLTNHFRELSSLPYAEQVARERLGMVNTDPRKVIYLKDPAASGYSPGALWRRLGRLFR